MIPSEELVAEYRRGYQDGLDDRLKIAAGNGTLRTEVARPASELIAYLDALFVSGNDVPTTSTLFAYSSLQIIKEILAEGLPLDYHVVEAEAVYRRKLAAYGDETRATSPLAALRKNAAPQTPGTVRPGDDARVQPPHMMGVGEPLSKATSAFTSAVAAPVVPSPQGRPNE